MAIKLDTSTPLASKATSFDPLPGVTSLNVGDQQAFNAIAQSAGNVANSLAKQEQASQQILINKARYNAMGQMEADYNDALDAINNNKENAKELLATFNSKYQSIDLNQYLGDDNVNEITKMDLAQNSIGELQYRYGSLQNKLKRTRDNVNLTNEKINFVKTTADGFNDFWANNPILNEQNELQFKGLVEGLNPENENIQPFMFGSTSAAQSRSFNTPIGSLLKNNLETYLSSSVFIDELDEKEQYVKDIYAQFGSEYGLDVANINTSTLRKNIIQYQTELAQEKIDEVLIPLQTRFDAAIESEGVFRFQDNMFSVIEEVSKLDPRLIKYASDEQKEFIQTSTDLYEFSLVNEDKGTSPLQDTILEAIVLGDANEIVQTVTDLDLSEKATSKAIAVASEIADNINDGINNNTPDSFKLLFPELKYYLQNDDWSSANRFYQEKILKLPYEFESDGKTYAGDLGTVMSLPPVLLNYSQLERVKTEGIRDAGVLQEIVEQFFNDNGNNDQISIGLQYLVNGEGGGLTDDQAVFATLASYLSNIDPDIRPTLLRAYAERLVPVSGRPQIEATQIASIKEELQNQQSDDFEFKILGETGLLQDQFPVVDLMFNQVALGNLTNTSYASFNDRIINNIIAETVADGGDARAAADSINNFTDRFMKPYFGIPSAVEHQGNYVGVTLHPSTIQELVDPEQGFGRSLRIGHDIAKNLLPFNFDLNFTDGTGFENLVSVNQSKFNTRSITDVTESVLAATLAHSYTSNSLDLTSYYRTMGQEGVDFTGEYKKNFNDGHAFITGAVKNQYISSTNIFGAPTEGAVQKSIVKIGHGKLYGIDVYIPMYLDSISGKYTQFTDLRGHPVAVPVAVVNHSIQRFNRDKNRVLFWQAQDLKGPYQSKASMYLNYIDPDMEQGPSRITGAGPIQTF
jgi:hypothetical protein